MTAAPALTKSRFGVTTDWFMNYLEFKGNPAGKLDHDYFTVIVPSDKKYQDGQVWTLRVAGEPHCKARIMHTMTRHLGGLNNRDTLLDAGMQRGDYDRAMCRFHHERGVRIEDLDLLQITFQRVKPKQDDGDGR